MAHDDDVLMGRFYTHVLVVLYFTHHVSQSWLYGHPGPSSYDTSLHVFHHRLRIQRVDKRSFPEALLFHHVVLCPQSYWYHHPLDHCYYPAISGVSYFTIFLAAAGYSSQAPIAGAWASNNIPNPSKRAASIGLLMLFGSVEGGDIGSNIYLEEQAPKYPLGFGFSVGATIVGAMIPTSIHWWLIKCDNQRKYAMDKDAILAEQTASELSKMEEYSPLYRYTL
jgi:hypothetical protein